MPTAWQIALKNCMERRAGLMSLGLRGYNSFDTDITGMVKTDFYVPSRGTAVPSTGYRYFARNPELLQSAKDGVLTAKSNGMYFSFNKIDDSIIARGKLQIPYRPEYRVSFDTLQIIDDIKVPKGDWGRARYLEPLTKDFKQFGPGKATQAITNSPVNVYDINKLRRE